MFKKETLPGCSNPQCQIFYHSSRFLLPVVFSYFVLIFVKKSWQTGDRCGGIVSRYLTYFTLRQPLIQYYLYDFQLVT